MIFESRTPHVPASLNPTSFVAAPTRFGQWSVFKSKCKCGQFTSYAFSAFPTFLYPGLLQTCPRQPDPRRQLSEVLKTCKSTLVSCSQKSLKKKKKHRNDRGTGVHEEQFLYCCCGQLSRLEGMANSFETPSFITCQAPLSMGCPRQGSWSGLPFPSPGDLPDLVIEPAFPALAALDSLLLSQQGSPS